MRWIAVAVLGLAWTSCGGDPPWSELAAKCATPRTGSDPATGQPYPDRQGTVDDEKTFLRSWTDDLYLWYSEVPQVDPSQYATAVDYFAQLKTPAITPSGNPKDRFHFWDTTAHWESLSQSGVEAGYGVTWALLARTPPRKAVAAYNEPGSPAAAQNVNRGVEVLTVDGADLVNGSDQATVDKLNAGLFPQAPNETHAFTLRDLDGTTRTVTLTSINVTSVPVQNVHSIGTGSDKVGYMLFNDHLATAEKALVDAVNQLKTEAVTDLVLDIRYNGGGYLAIAGQLAYMIAGPGKTSGKTFEQLTFNDKHPGVDPIANRPLTPTPFYNQTLGFSAPQGTSLPSLGLSRVFVLTGSGTCSASESIINGLSGVDVQVIQIGKTTCGKPYGFYPQDNCGTTYFSIQFKGVNAKGFGDYADGFSPAATTPGSLPGCQVADDFGHALGDANEARLAAALAYRTSPTCPAPTSRTAATYAASRGEGEVIKSIWRQNRIVQR
jgi:carboxyl-terminal processing protease